MEDKKEENDNYDEIFKDLSKKRNLEEINDLVIGGKIAFNDYKMNLSSKYIINKDPETKALLSNSMISFFHQLSPWMKYSFTQSQGALKFCTSMSPINNFLLTTNLLMDNTEKVSSIPVNALAKYKFKNNLAIQLGIKDYDTKKEKYLPTICTGLSKPFHLWGNNRLFMGYSNIYCLKDKYCKSNNFGVIINNTFLNTLLNISFNKKNKSSNWEKFLKFKTKINVSDNLSLGTEINYNTEDKKGTKLQLFSNYIIDPFTKFVTEWDDKDKSISFNMNHDFRGLAKLGITGKFTPTEAEKKESKTSKIPSFKSKIGVSVDIFEPLL